MKFNSREYEWADVSVVIGARSLTGIRGVQYSEAQEKEALYAKGNRPHAIQHGNVSFSGTVTLLQSELDFIEAAAGGNLLAASMDIIVSYGNPSRGDVIKTDRLVGVEFTEVPKGLNQNDKFMEVALPIIMLDVIRNYE